MTFPFVVEFEQNIKLIGDTASELKAFEIIQTYLKSKHVEDCYQTGNIIKFKKSFFGMNTNVFAIIDRGEFELVENKGIYKLQYRFYFIKHFIISTLMSVVIGFISQNFIFSVIIFFLFVVINFIISLIKQQGVINDIVYKIDESYRNRNTNTI